MRNTNKRTREISDAEEARIQKGIADDPENPEWTEEDFKNARPFREVFSDLAATVEREITKRGRPPLEKTKQPVTIRLDPDLVEHYKATGKGWQSRMNDDLRKAAGI